MTLHPIAILHRRRINRNKNLSLDTIQDMKANGMSVTLIGVAERLRMIERGSIPAPTPREVRLDAIQVIHLN